MGYTLDDLWNELEKAREIIPPYQEGDITAEMYAEHFGISISRAGEVIKDKGKEAGWECLSVRMPDGIKKKILRRRAPK